MNTNNYAAWIDPDMRPNDANAMRAVLQYLIAPTDINLSLVSNSAQANLLVIPSPLVPINVYA